MISRYSFGKPFETEALVVKIEATEGKLPFFRTDGEGNCVPHIKNVYPHDDVGYQDSSWYMSSLFY